MSDHFEVPRVRVPYGATVELQGLLEGWGQTPLLPADVASVAWTVYQFNQARRTLTELDGYAEAAIATPGDVLYATLHEWDMDEVGFNFHHVPPNRTTAPFLEIGGVYRVHYTFTPQLASQQLIIVPFEIEVV